MTAFVVRPADTADGYSRWPDRAADPAASRPSSGASACRTASTDADGDEFPPVQESLPHERTEHDRTRWLALYVLCAGMLMIVLDATIVNVALPSIQDDLGFSQSNLAWVVNAYLIPFGGLLLLAGRIGDLLGQRRVFLVGLASSPPPRCSAPSRRARRC